MDRPPYLPLLTVKDYKALSMYLQQSIT